MEPTTPSPSAPQGGGNPVLRVVTLVLVLAVLALGAYYLYTREGRRATETGTSSASRSPTTFRIVMDQNGFSPSELFIRVGDTVVFENADNRNRWPASAVHPTHEVCPGFDSLAPVPAGGSYEHTFIETQECPFHDHLLPNLRGRIVVQ